MQLAKDKVLLTVEQCEYMKKVPTVEQLNVWVLELVLESCFMMSALDGKKHFHIHYYLAFFSLTKH